MVMASKYISVSTFCGWKLCICFITDQPQAEGLFLAQAINYAHFIKHTRSVVTIM